MKATFKNSLLPVCGVLIAAIFFQTLVSQRRFSFDGFTGISWFEKKICEFNQLAETEQIICSSNTLKVSQQDLELIVKNTSPIKIIFSAVDQTENSVWLIDTTPNKLDPEKYSFSHHIKLPLSLVNKDITISVISANSAFLKLLVSKRLVLSSAKRNIFINIKSSKILLFIASFVIALLLFWSGKKVTPHITSDKSLLVLAFIIALLFQFRALTFFHWDEWNVLARFAEDGFKDAFSRHNEHFIPLFFSGYFTEIMLFRGFYQGFVLISCLLLAINSVLCAQLVRKVFSLNSLSLAITDKTLALLYAVNASHAESVQWALAQCSLLSLTFVLLGLIKVADFIETKKTKLLFLSGACAIVSCLVFGNGFSFFPAAIIVAIATLFLQSKKLKSIVEKRNSVLLLKLFASLLISGLICLAIYLLNPAGTGHSAWQIKTEGLSFIRVTQQILFYLVVITQLGTVLRGIGIFPSLWEETPSFILHSTSVQPEVVFAFFGLCMSIALCITICKTSSDKKLGLTSCAVGIALMIVFCLLPSVARWSFGFQEALEPRYQESALIGLCFLIFPLVGLQKHSKLLQFVLLLHLTSQMYMALDFTKFTEAAESRKLFISQLVDWDLKLRTIGKNASLKSDYKAGGTNIYNLAPVMPKDFATGLQAHEVLPLLRKLKLLP